MRWVPFGAALRLVFFGVFFGDTPLKIFFRGLTLLFSLVAIIAKMDSSSIIEYNKKIDAGKM